MTLEKEVRLGENEKRMLGLRIEAHNLLNHTEFSNIGSSLQLLAGKNVNTTFGQCTATLAARVMSTTLRFELESPNEELT